MRNKVAVSVVAMVSASRVLLAASITPAAAWNFWRHHYSSPGYFYHREPVVIAPSVGVGDEGVGAYWASPQPGWSWHSYDWYSGHDDQWRAMLPLPSGPGRRRLPAVLA